MGEEPETVEVVAEPFLVRQGLLARTPRGRVATAAAWAHLGMTPPPDAFGAYAFRLITDDWLRNGDSVANRELPRAPNRCFVAAFRNNSPTLRGLAGCVG